MLKLRFKPNKNDTSIKMLQWAADKIGFSMPTTICGYFWMSVLIPYLSICLLVGIPSGVDSALNLFGELTGLYDHQMCKWTVYLNEDWFQFLLSLPLLLIIAGVGMLLGTVLPFMLPAGLFLVLIITSTQDKYGCNRPWFDNLLTKLSNVYNKICPKIDID